MVQTMTWVGLDVHARSVHAAVVDAETGELRRLRMGGDDGRGGALPGRAAGSGAGGVRGGPDRVWARARGAGGGRRDDRRRAGQDAARGG